MYSRCIIVTTAVWKFSCNWQSLAYPAGLSFRNYNAAQIFASKVVHKKSNPFFKVYVTHPFESALSGPTRESSQFTRKCNRYKTVVSALNEAAMDLLEHRTFEPRL